MIQVTVPNFFYFAEISKMSELEPKNVFFSGIPWNYGKINVFWLQLAHFWDFGKIKKIWNSNLDHFQQLLLNTFLPTMTFIFRLLLGGPEILKTISGAEDDLKSKNWRKETPFKIKFYMKIHPWHSNMMHPVAHNPP